MKKLLIFPFLLLTSLGLSQSLDGVNDEHLLISQTPATQLFNVKRIKLSTGVTLDYVEQGNTKGTPVIFLHGLSDSWHSFEKVLPHLPPTIHAFALTQRGHGDSERPAEGYSPKNFAADVAAFIKEKQLGIAVIVGHSMGGVITQQFALDYPQLTKAIVLIGSDASFRSNPGMTEFFQNVNKMEGSLSWEFMNEFQKETISKPIDSSYYQLLVAEGMKPPLSVFKAALKGLIDTDLSAQLKNIEVPAFIVWGDKDSFCYRKGQERFANSMKNARLVVYQGIGHSVHWQEPKRFADELVDFIQSPQLSRHETKNKN